MNTILLVILILLLIGGLPTWGYHDYGYYPSGGLGFVLLMWSWFCCCGEVAVASAPILE